MFRSILKQRFFFTSATVSRFFILRTSQPTTLSSQSLRDQGLLIFEAQRDKGMVYIFNCKDEVIPYDFIKQDQSVSEFIIEEIEIHTKGQSKQLAQLFKYR